jgi:hypothetical protein
MATVGLHPRRSSPWSNTGTVRAPLNDMATRAESFRSEQERSNQRPKAKQAKTKAPVPEHKQGVRGTAARNLKTSPSHVKDGPALESSDTGKPSRKSTRGSSGHIKLATNLQRRQVRRVHSPESRAARSAVRQ